MDEETSGYLLTLLAAGPKTAGYTVPEKDKPFLVKMIEKRLPIYQYEIKDNRLIVFIAIVARVAGRAVMYLEYLRFWSAKHGVTDFTLELFCQRVFPKGFPADEDLHKLWDANKPS